MNPSGYNAQKNSSRSGAPPVISAQAPGSGAQPPGTEALFSGANPSHEINIPSTNESLPDLNIPSSSSVKPTNLFKGMETDDEFETPNLKNTARRVSLENNNLETETSNTLSVLDRTQK